MASSPYRSAQVRLPSTSREHAVRNLEASLPIFEAIAGSAQVARPYWTLACEGVRRLPLPYVGLSPVEVFDMVGALSGDLSAVPHLEALTEYQDGAPAYPMDILYSVGQGVDRYSPRTWNASVLDCGFVTPKYVQWNCSPQTPAPVAEALPESAYG